MVGVHKFLRVNPKTGREEEYQVEVKKVVVVRQALGGLIDVATILIDDFSMLFI